MEIALPAEAQDPRERFAREMVSRSHRLQEVCSVLKLDQVQAFDLLRDPLVQAHITRLTTVGRAAMPLVDALEIAEVPLGIIRMTNDDFLEIAEQVPGKGSQSFAQFLSVRLDAADWLKKAFFPAPDAILKRMQKEAKKRGEVFDRAKAAREIEAILTNTEPPKEDKK